MAPTAERHTSLASGYRVGASYRGVRGRHGPNARDDVATAHRDVRYLSRLALAIAAGCYARTTAAVHVAESAALATSERDRQMQHAEESLGVLR